MRFIACVPKGALGTVIDIEDFRRSAGGTSEI